VNLRLLIDGIVRQTTVLVAQLATTSGVRSPIAQIADQVFLQLTYELENQGVPRAVAADMFGMALRAYQKKIARLTESASNQGVTLWQAVYELVKQESPTRRRILERFQHDGEREVASVLHDLVSNGMLFTTGEGSNAVYGVTTEHMRKQVLDSSDLDALVHIVWWRIFDGLTSAAQLAESLGVEVTRIQEAVTELERSGQVSLHDGQLLAKNLYIPAGSASGAEAAMLDHFRAVCQLIAVKSRSFYDGVVAGVPAPRPSSGGSTFSFTVYPEHPDEAAVEALLQRMRTDVQQLWLRVSAHNEANPPPDTARKVTFYCGQVTPAKSTLND
jgi:hypothetical protein